MLDIAYTQHQPGDHAPTHALVVSGMLVQRADCPVRGFVVRPNHSLLALAEGLDRRPLPYAASAAVVQDLRDAWRQDREPRMDGSTSQALVRTLHERLCARPELDTPLPRPGATLAAAHVAGTRIKALNVGTTRVFRIGKVGGVEMLSQDHTFAQAMIERGELRMGDRYPTMYDRDEHALVADPGWADVAVHETRREADVGDVILVCSRSVKEVAGRGALAGLSAGGDAKARLRRLRKLLLAADPDTPFSMAMMVLLPDAP